MQCSFSLYNTSNNCQCGMFQTQHWNPQNIVLFQNTVATLISSEIFIPLSSSNWTCFRMVPFKSVSPLVSWGIIRGGTDYSPLSWNIEESIGLQICNSLSDTTVREKKGNKNRTIPCTPQQRRTPDWTKQSRERTSQ